jgi:uncharacterized YccA/Bax inhibitor family protein
MLLGTFTFTWSKAMDAFGNFDWSTVRQVKVTEGGKERTVSMVVSRDPETEREIQTPLPKFELGTVSTLMWTGIIVGFLSGMICIFVPRGAWFFGSIYALAEGLALGGISAIFEVRYPGIAMQAAGLTMAVMLTMSMLYATGLIRVTGGFVTGIIACTGGIALLYLVDILLSAFGGGNISIIHSNSAWGIGFSVFVCVLAAFNFFLDFDAIEQGVKRGAPKHMEWYCAFGVLTTLVWLYLEILRLLAKLKSRD